MDHSTTFQTVFLVVMDSSTGASMSPALTFDYSSLGIYVDDLSVDTTANTTIEEPITSSLCYDMSVNSKTALNANWFKCLKTGARIVISMPSTSGLAIYELMAFENSMIQLTSPFSYAVSTQPGYDCGNALNQLVNFEGEPDTSCYLSFSARYAQNVRYWLNS